MPMVLPGNSTFGGNSRCRRSRNLNHWLNQQEPISETDPIPSINNIDRSKSAIFSLLFSSNDNPTTVHNKKKNFSSSTFRGLGCTASSQVSVPAVIRNSADWETKKVKKKKQNSKKNQGTSSATALALGGITSSSSTMTSATHTNSSSSINPLSIPLSSSCVAGPDVWCGPGMGLATDAASVDCVVSRRPLSGRGKVDGEKMSHRERPSFSVRRMVTPEDIPFLDSEAFVPLPRSRLDAFGSRHHRHARHGFPGGLAEIVMLQNNLLMGGRSGGLDRYRDWRLDVDHKSYEELLELGDQIGYVSTGLREDEISRSVRKTKAADNLRSRIRTELERKCSICQEYEEEDDEMGKLNCGHFFHLDCIKQWLAKKNSCPLCKTEVVSK